MGMRVSLDTIQAVTVATAVLHNIACEENEPVPEVNVEQEPLIHFGNVNDEPPNVQNVHVNNNIVRNALINYFANL